MTSPDDHGLSDTDDSDDEESCNFEDNDHGLSDTDDSVDHNDIEYDYEEEEEEVEGDDEGAFCENCMRFNYPNIKAFHGTTLGIKIVNSSDIRGVHSHLRQVLAHRSVSMSCDYTLCKECRNFLDRTLVLGEKESKAWKNTWPSFMWNLLSGKDRRHNGDYFHKSYEAKKIWKFIPFSIRKYWMV